MIKIEDFCTKNEDFNQIYGSKTQKVQQTLIHSKPDRNQSKLTVCIAHLIPKYKPETEVGLLTSCIVGGGSKDLGGVFGVGGRSLRGNGHVVSTVKKIF